MENKSVNSMAWPKVIEMESFYKRIFNEIDFFRIHRS